MVLAARSDEDGRPLVVSGFFGADAILPVRVDEPDDSCEEDKFDDEMKAVEDLFEARVGLPAVA